MDDGDGALRQRGYSRDEKGCPQVDRVPVTVKAQSSTTAVIEGAGIEDGTGGDDWRWRYHPRGAIMDAPASRVWLIDWRNRLQWFRRRRVYQGNWRAHKLHRIYETHAGLTHALRGVVKRRTKTT